MIKVLHFGPSRLMEFFVCRDKPIIMQAIENYGAAYEMTIEMLKKCAKIGKRMDHLVSSGWQYYYYEIRNKDLLSI